MDPVNSARDPLMYWKWLKSQNFRLSFMYSTWTVTLCLQLHVPKKKKEENTKEGNADAESTESKQAQIYHIYMLPKIKDVLELISMIWKEGQKEFDFFFFLGQKDISMIQKEHDAVFTFKKKSYLWRILTLSS